MQHALTIASDLAMPNFSKTFVIEHDASGRVVGALLMQDDQPIAFFSKAIADKAMAKSICEKEVMVVVLYIHHWCLYSLG